LTVDNLGIPPACMIHMYNSYNIHYSILLSLTDVDAYVLVATECSADHSVECEVAQQWLMSPVCRRRLSV